MLSFKLNASVMAIEILRLRIRKKLLDNASLPVGICCSRMLTTGEVATALRPFYFSVHPDLFGKFPAERATNENSLQILSSYIENLQQNRPPRPANLRFFLRPVGQDTPVSRSESLKSVNIKLSHRDIRVAVKSILTSCELPTTYVDSRPLLSQESKTSSSQFRAWRPPPKYNYTADFHDQKKYSEEDVSQRVNEVKGSETLLNWLSRHVDSAKMKLQACEPVREEVSRLQEVLSRRLKAAEVSWECGWNITSFRGCLQALQALAEQHPEHLGVLEGRQIVFGSDTGVSRDGAILLNSAEVRHNWLDFIKNLSNQDKALSRLPHFEKALSQVLRDIKIVRRKFQPHQMATQYENNLRRLTTTLGDCHGRGGFPKNWPKSLSTFELVVETEAGPMMVSPTGQFILPCSCPSFLLVNFISENMGKALELLSKYKQEKEVEKELHKRCTDELGIIALDKDDCITPQKMIVCCTALLNKSNELKGFLDALYSVELETLKKVPYSLILLVHFVKPSDPWNDMTLLRKLILKDTPHIDSL
ncbi:T cell activation inhibitor, mitochondrial [Nesidiocoris tenuis]|uniref:T cell activation inhibitor, mitochondrial n=1 Tax=Nesidiocoris tenuis TaxID=355587 RepID=A0ABN7ABI2_9HEMI|nr:T cell activation inhibitor, mitochondrial [Nesidiocoris tenuis]